MVFFRRKIIELKLENAVFETALERKRLEPVASHTPSVAPPASSSQATASAGSHQDSPSTGVTSRTERLARKRSKSRSTQGDIRIQLTFKQKLAIIASEYEQMRLEKSRHKTMNEKKIDQLEV